MQSDRNFDDLAKRFQKNIYGGLKGRIRLAVLKQDFQQFYPQALQLVVNRPLRILDAGGGRGPFSLLMAQAGHHVTLCDLSAEMLKLAAHDVAEKQLHENVSLIHNSIQSLPIDTAGFDLVLCHAVLEWVQEPEALLKHLVKLVKPSGCLSLTFYNKNGIIFKNLLRTNYAKILQQDYTGTQGSLTPTFPQQPEQVKQWLENAGVDILCHSGMRVFHDYILDKQHAERDPDTVVALELSLSRQQPFRDMGRYQHMFCAKAG